MPLHRETLVQLPSAAHCINAITTMHAAFKAAHKRNATVDLFYSLVFSTDVELLNEPDTHLITLQAEDASEAASPEVAWFRVAAKQFSATGQ